MKKIMSAPIRFDYRTDDIEEYIKKMMQRGHGKDFVVRKILDTMIMDGANTDGLMEISTRLSEEIAAGKLKFKQTY